jgi:hypothetical protein
LEPSFPKLVQTVKNPWLQALQDHAISVFNLPICSRVRHSYPIHADVAIIAKAKEFLASELGTIIGDDTIW